MPIKSNDSQAKTEYASGIDLDAKAPRIVAGSWVALEIPGTAMRCLRVRSSYEHSRADFAMSAQVTHIELAKLDGLDVVNLGDFKLRNTTVHVESERLELAPLPLADEVPAGTAELLLDGIVLDLTPGKPLAFAGEDLDLGGVRRTEVVTLTSVAFVGGSTKLGFGALAYGYKRSTLEIAANVVGATHGETAAREPLGSGSGRPDQRFALRRRPLTYVAEPAGTGAASTLEVRVGGVLWRQVPSLLGLGPRDECYAVRHDDAAGTQLIFGDGVRGACPPSGLENVVATYRHGIGAGGMLPGGSLTLLQTRPPGVRSVINPAPSYGADDPESRDAARANAPVTVVTLDRVVSLSDYEAFAAAFAGIGKASASAFVQGQRQIVHVTVTTPGGEEVAEETRTALTSALGGAGEAGVIVVVVGVRPIAFELAANVLLDGRREPLAVIAEVRAALTGRFGFQRRAFGQGVTEAEVLTVVLGVAGVVDGRLTTLRPVGASEAGTQDPLPARRASWSPSGDGTIEPAELVFLESLGATISERSA